MQALTSNSFLLKKVTVGSSRYWLCRKAEGIMAAPSLLRWLYFWRLFKRRMALKENWRGWQPKKTHRKRTQISWGKIHLWTSGCASLQNRLWGIFNSLEERQEARQDQKNLSLLWSWRSSKICWQSWESFRIKSLCGQHHSLLVLYWQHASYECRSTWAWSITKETPWKHG